MPKPRDESQYHTGTDDGLSPLVPLDLSKTQSIDALVAAMSQTAFGGRRLGEAADVLEAMIRDRCGCPYALMVPNGTLALFAALKVLGIGPGDEVLEHGIGQVAVQVLYWWRAQRLVDLVDALHQSLEGVAGVET